jgi:hypothetical protein
MAFKLQFMQSWGTIHAIAALEIGAKLVVLFAYDRFQDKQTARSVAIVRTG